jgi:hypothetical protein
MTEKKGKIRWFPIPIFLCTVKCHLAIISKIATDQPPKPFSPSCPSLKYQNKINLLKIGKKVLSTIKRASKATKVFTRFSIVKTRNPRTPVIMISRPKAPILKSPILKTLTLKPQMPQP